MFETLRDIVFRAFDGGRIGLAMLLLRLFVGLAFINHGGGKLADIAAFQAEFDIPSWYLAAAACWTQLVGGILLIVGLLTPFAALGIVSTVTVATIVLISKGEPFINPAGHSYENSAFYIFAGLVIALVGAGKYSLDRLVFKKREPETSVAEPIMGGERRPLNADGAG